jgi:hypothetical protein
VYARNTAAATGALYRLCNNFKKMLTFLFYFIISAKSFCYILYLASWHSFQKLRILLAYNIHLYFKQKYVTFCVILKIEKRIRKYLHILLFDPESW